MFNSSNAPPAFYGHSGNSLWFNHLDVLLLPKMGKTFLKCSLRFGNSFGGQLAVLQFHDASGDSYHVLGFCWRGFFLPFTITNDFFSGTWTGLEQAT